MAENDDEYKEIIKQCIGSVKEVFGEGKFDDVVASIMKMQEKVLTSSIKRGEEEIAGQIAAEGGESSIYERVLNDVREEFKEDLKVIKKRILRLERLVLDPSNNSNKED